jgi:parallel beta-helix repeat protein
MISLCALLTVLCPSAAAATLCVNQGGSSGCFSRINAAVSAASANDTINVAAGTYAEDVIITKSLSLIGAGSASTIIDATRLPNGIYIDGIDNPGLSHVVVTGFTLENANFEGILITNAFSISIWNNHVMDNDKSLNPSAGTCPGQPEFETAEDFDCGEGIHLSGVHQSIIGNNLVERNSGGILLSDDTGKTHDNVITGNIVRENPFDCGITLASHVPASLTGSKTPLGVFHNTISGNESSRNGLQGEGAGVGIFDSAPGTMNYRNVVIGNRLIGNGLPGVAMHSHTPNQNLNNNEIIGNYIARNGADTEDAFTPGPTGINIFGVSPINGTIITQNAINNETVEIAINTPSTVDIHFNDLNDDTLGVDNLGPGTVNATENWWGCPGGPGAEGCSSAGGPGILFTPWLPKPVRIPPFGLAGLATQSNP